MPTSDALRSAVLAALDDVVDPCSVSAGVALGLVQMGLVRDLSVDPSGNVTVVLRLTSPGCMIGVVQFPEQIHKRLASVDGVADVNVEFDHNFDWSEDAVSAQGRERLAEVRKARLLRLTARLR
jgi:metal-sulfur cluster biosynthetic enzyme